jgi:hypothetical protein
MNHQRITRFYKIPRHGFAHDAKTDKADGRIAHDFSPSLL